jgi:glycine cleavage system H protein
MSNVPPELRYAKSHEWLRVAGDTGTVGLTDHAQHELTDVVFVELPAVGRALRAGETCAVVESVKTASDVYSPVAGTVTAVNAAVVANPALINTDPYGGGWLFQLKLASAAQVDVLFDAAAYGKLTGAG